MGSDDLRAANRLGEQQFHGAAIDLAGDGVGGPTDRPDAQNRQDQRMDIRNRHHVPGLVERDVLAADDRLHELPHHFIAIEHEIL